MVAPRGGTCSFRSPLKPAATAIRKSFSRSLSMVDDRRKDPRTSRTFSLGNLLRMRAERLSWEVALVGTRDGFLLASSRGAQDRFAHQTAAHVSAQLFAGARAAGRDGP